MPASFPKPVKLPDFCVPSVPWPSRRSRSTTPTPATSRASPCRGARRPRPRPRSLFFNEPLAAGARPRRRRARPGRRRRALRRQRRCPQGAEPIAQAYAGHQFGGFSPQLGDGRALLLGEVIDRHGRRRDIAFKGSGRTPFSRGGDGKAAVGPMLREVLIGEAMHALGIPTTRALAVVAHRRAGVPRARAARRGADARRGEPPARRHVPVLRRARRRRAACASSPTTPSRATIPTWPATPSRYLGLLRARRRSARPR